MKNENLVENTSSTEIEAAPLEEKKYFKAFETKEEYQDNVDRIFNSRFKDYKETKSKYSDLVDSLKSYYDTDSDDIAIKMFNDKITEQNANKKGLSVSDYKKYDGLEKKAERYDKLVEKQRLDQSREMANQLKIQGIRNRLLGEAEMIKGSDADFDLDKAYENDDKFRESLENTGSVFLAYATANSEKTKKERFHESGSQSMLAGHISASAADLSDSDFEKYIKQIQEG